MTTSTTEMTAEQRAREKRIAWNRQDALAVVRRLSQEPEEQRRVPRRPADCGSSMSGQLPLRRLEIVKGSRKVIAFRNDEECAWWSRMYVNNGETATLVSARHRTEKGVRKWAEKVLDR